MVSPVQPSSPIPDPQHDSRYLRPDVPSAPPVTPVPVVLPTPAVPPGEEIPASGLTLSSDGWAWILAQPSVATATPRFEQVIVLPPPPTINEST